MFEYSISNTLEMSRKNKKNMMPGTKTFFSQHHIFYSLIANVTNSATEKEFHPPL